MNRYARFPLLAAAGLLMGASAGCAADGVDAAQSEDEMIRACAPAPKSASISLPADEGPHANQASEWWYYTGHLVDRQGARYGFELVFFQFPSASYAQFAVTDANGNAFYHQTSAPSATPSPMTKNRFDLKSASGWSAKGSGGNDHIQARMDNGGAALDLFLQPKKHAAFDYNEGKAQFPTGEAFAYSRTRLAGIGTLSIGKNEMWVDGDVWFDHQWGAFSPDLGWDWMGLQLDNGEELMAVQMRDAHTQTVLGTTGNFISHSCVTADLAPNDPQIVPTGNWTSPHTQKTYPSGWTVKVPSKDLDLTLTPVLKDQELYMSPATYWEGEVTFTGTEHGKPVSGRGYVELVGY